MIVPVLRMRVCAVVYIVTVCCLEHVLGWSTAYYVVSDAEFPRWSPINRSCDPRQVRVRDC